METQGTEHDPRHRSTRRRRAFQKARRRPSSPRAGSGLRSCVVDVVRPALNSRKSGKANHMIEHVAEIVAACVGKNRLDPEDVAESTPDREEAASEQ